MLALSIMTVDKLGDVKEFRRSQLMADDDYDGVGVDGSDGGVGNVDKAWLISPADMRLLLCGRKDFGNNERAIDEAIDCLLLMCKST